MTYNVDKNKEEIDSIASSKYYGQWETDKFIEKYFPNQSRGCCIEVGAADGIKGSNTKYFEDLGWDVLCIEPNTGFSKSLEAHRQLVRYYAVGSGEEGSTATLTIFDVGEKSIMSSLSSLKPDKRLVEAHQHIINGSEDMAVPVRTLPYILENTVKGTPFHNRSQIDFISIDTEGTELDVLKGFDFSAYDVKLFVVENNYADADIEKYMSEHGYVLKERWKINDFYTRNEL
jgi:FkbM family methyltransferase